MKAAVIRQHGEIDEITFEADWPEPTPGAGEVKLKVSACALNYHDLFTLKGMPGIKINFPLIMGIDLSGEVAGLVGRGAGGDRSDRPGEAGPHR
jgi:alcohol dehydrogenase